jgi:hypothetical protein
MPTTSSHVATKEYVDTEVARNPMKVVRAATTDDIDLKYLRKVDGVSLDDGDRVLVKNQKYPQQNGLYVAVDGPWSRAPDAREDPMLVSGTTVVVTEGDRQGGTQWRLATLAPIVLDSTGLTFEPVVRLPATPQGNAKSPLIVQRDGKGEDLTFWSTNLSGQWVLGYEGNPTLLSAANDFSFGPNENPGGGLRQWLRLNGDGAVFCTGPSYAMTDRLRVLASGVVVGSGEGQNTGLSDGELRAPDAVAGINANVAAPKLVLRTGKGTGNAAQQAIVLQANVPGVSGGGQQSVRTVAAFADHVITLSTGGSERLRVTNGLSVGTSIDPGAGNIRTSRLGVGVTPSVGLHLAAGLARTRTARTGAYAATSNDGIVGMDTSGSAATVTLPAASSVPAGFELIIKDEGGVAATAGKNITVTRSGTDLIDGQTSVNIATNYGVLRLYSNGSSRWFTF